MHMISIPESHTASYPCLTRSIQVIPCLRYSLTVIPLPHTVTQRHPPASHIQSRSSPCLGNSLTVIPPPQTITQHQPPASDSHSPRLCSLI